MEKNNKSLTVAYSFVQASFWMDLCIALSFASVYLLGLGDSNSALGLIIAAGNLIGAMIGPGLSSMIDRKEDVTAARVMPYVLAARFVMLAVLIFFPGSKVMTSVGFTLYIAFSMSVNSLNLKLYVDAAHNGLIVDYGKARGMGSLAYVIISSLLGFLITATSIRVIPWAGIAVGIIQIVSFAAFARGASSGSKYNAGEQKTGDSLALFARKNKRFCVLLAGTVLIFFSHNTVCNFLINVTNNIGGGTDEMGLLNGFMAAVEIPVMLTFTRFFGKRDAGKLLRFAFLMFTLKAAAIAAAGSMPAMAAAFVLQAPSFAIYTAAIVPYIENTIPHEDSAKAQSLAFTMTTFSSVLAGTVSGMLYDNISVTATLWIAAIVCAAGTIISISGTER
ncbi:MAG: MFS transporter [Mogibacterium sp.]|nr:MFS transporter [Mogibacterium sp.]MBR2540560.1 MFS transporter [Mogibacterium sp.]